MGEQSVRQAARRAALDARSRVQAARASQEKRLTDLAIEVVTAARERQAAERRAGAALARMTSEEKISLTEALRWCGGEVSRNQAMVWRRLTTEDGQAPVGEDQRPVDADEVPVAGRGSAPSGGLAEG